MHDVGAATANLLLQATALGLVAHPMGGFDGARLLREFAVPEGFEPLAMVAVGHPGDAALLSERNQARESAPRTRAPLGERFFEGAWGRGFAP
jgi:nitroreductase